MEIKHFMGNSWFRHENPPAEEEEENWSPRKAFLSRAFYGKSQISVTARFYNLGRAAFKISQPSCYVC